MAKKVSIPFKNSNLYLVGFGKDTNGNSVVKLSFPNSRAFSIQTNGTTLPHTHDWVWKRKPTDLDTAELSIIEKEVAHYVYNFGSKNQKKKLRLYENFEEKILQMEKGGGVDYESVSTEEWSSVDPILKKTGGKVNINDVPQEVIDRLEYEDAGDLIEWELHKDPKTDQLYKVDMWIERDFSNVPKKYLEVIEYAEEIRGGGAELWFHPDLDDTAYEIPIEYKNDMQSALPVKSFHQAKFGGYDEKPKFKTGGKAGSEQEYLDKAQQMIDSEDHLAHDLALERGQIFSNVKETKWFKNALAERIKVDSTYSKGGKIDKTVFRQWWGESDSSGNFYYDLKELKYKNWISEYDDSVEYTLDAPTFHKVANWLEKNYPYKEDDDYRDESGRGIDVGELIQKKFKLPYKVATYIKDMYWMDERIKAYPEKFGKEELSTTRTKTKKTVGKAGTKSIIVATWNGDNMTDGNNAWIEDVPNARQRLAELVAPEFEGVNEDEIEIEYYTNDGVEGVSYFFEEEGNAGHYEIYPYSKDVYGVYILTNINDEKLATKKEYRDELEYAIKTSDPQESYRIKQADLNSKKIFIQGWDDEYMRMFINLTENNSDLITDVNKYLPPSESDIDYTAHRNTQPDKKKTGGKAGVKKSAKVDKLHKEALKLFNDHIMNEGKLDYPMKQYGYLDDELDDIAIGWYGETPDGDYQVELAENGFTLTESETIDGLQHRIDSIKEDLEPPKPDRHKTGGKVDDDGKAIRRLVKNLKDTPHEIGLGVLRERMLTHADHDLKHPKQWEYWLDDTFMTTGMYKDFLDRCVIKLSFKNDVQNRIAVNSLVKNLKNTPNEIGLAVMREALLIWCKEDQTSIKKNPDAWENPILGVGMYKDFMNRCISELSFKTKGGVSNRDAEEIADTKENHKLGFIISLNTENNDLEAQRIDDPDGFAYELGYDFKIPQLKSDKEAKEKAESIGYLFEDKTNPLKVTGRSYATGGSINKKNR